MFSSAPPAPARHVRLAALMLLGAAAAAVFWEGLAMPAWAGPAPAVVVASVVAQNIAPGFSDIGHVTAIQSVKIVPRVTAFIDAVDFQQGSNVKAGQVLFSLQPAEYQAALQSAQAQLASAQAALANAELVYQRAENLTVTGVSPQSTLDADIAARNEAQASVLSAQAALANAQLNLSYCTITAPIDGRIGAVALTKGNLVTASTGTLATLNQMDPIRVEFSVPSDSPLLDAPDQYNISIDLPDGKPYQPQGKIAFIDNQVDSSTGTVNVYADFPNPAGRLLPGAYVNVQTTQVAAETALLVPVAAVQTDQSGSYVLTVDANGKVAQVPVVLGDQIAQNFVVKAGLRQGDNVIVDGIQKVKTGDIVTTTSASAP